jgi:predicted MFS family arabinose efflux permease
MIVWSTVFFILVPGRMVPAMAIVTSAVQPRLRGTFLSMNGAVQQLASGVASWLGGAMIAADATGASSATTRVGWLAMGATLPPWPLSAASTCTPGRRRWWRR